MFIALPLLLAASDFPVRAYVICVQDERTPGVIRDLMFPGLCHWAVAFVKSHCHCGDKFKMELE